MEQLFRLWTHWGVGFDDAQILTCLPPRELEEFKVQLERLAEDISSSAMGASPLTTSASASAFNNHVQALVAANVARQLTRAKKDLIQRLQHQDFREWVRDNQELMTRHGGPSRGPIERVSLLPRGGGSQKPLPSWFPLSAVFAFYNAYVGKDVKEGGVCALEATEILTQLIALGNSQGSPQALQAHASLAKEQRRLNSCGLQAVASGPAVSNAALADWKRHTEYKNGLDESSERVKWFWEAVASMSPAARANVWRYATGRTIPPPKSEGGCGAMEPKFKLVDRGSGKKEEDQMLITAATCHRQLCLPRYSSAQVTSRQLTLSVEQGLEQSRKQRALKRFQSKVHRAMTVHNNPSLLALSAMYRQTSILHAAAPNSLSTSELTHRPAVRCSERVHQAETSELREDAVRVMSVVEWEPRTPMVLRRATELVMMPPPEHEERIAARRKLTSKAAFVPSIVFISCSLAMLVILRSFIGNMVSLKYSLAWLLSIVEWLLDTCNQIEMFGTTGFTIFQCFTPHRLQQLVSGDAGRELKKGLNDLFAIRHLPQHSAAARSLVALKEITARVDFVSMEKDLERVNGVMVLAGKLQAEVMEMPPDIQKIRATARELDTEVLALEESSKRLQGTAKLVAASREDIMKVAQLSQDLQERTAQLQPLVAPLSDIFSCVASSFENFNWTALKEVALGSEPVSEWAKIFFKADQDGGGTLNSTEFEAIQWENYNSSKVELAQMDTDGSQELDEREWRQYHITGVAVAEAQVSKETAPTQGLAVENLETSGAQCRAFLQRHRCHEQLRDYLPRQREMRAQVLPLLSDLEDDLLPLPGAPEFQMMPEADGTLSEACRLYQRVGCAAPSMGFLLVNGEDDLERWRDLIHQRQKHFNYTIQVAREQSQDLKYFSTYNFTFSVITGNVVALIISVLLTRRLVVQFKVAVNKMRSGHPDGKRMNLEKNSANITSIEIPKIVGVTLMSWWFNFYIVGYVVAGLMGFISGPWLWKLVFDYSDDLLRGILEIGLVCVVSVVGLDMVVGTKILFGG
jgi:hypothetical protein